MAVQDDLATLLARNLTLTQSPPSQPQDDKIVYISQHYTHTAHISSAPPPAPPAHNTPHPPSSAPDLAALEQLLLSHGVATAALTLSQVELFRHADDAQKARLVQLWAGHPPAPPVYSISSNNHNNTNHNTGHSTAWGATAPEQEEMMLAHRRCEEQRQQAEAAAATPPEVAMSLDGTEVAMPQLSNSPGSVQSAGSGAWESGPGVAHAHTYMEPYMQRGYEALARREHGGGASRKAALDPAYQGGMLDWERQQWMENQYGSFVGGWGDDEEML